MRNKEINIFKYGLINSLSDKKIPDGAASNSLNFLTLGDKIELSRGFKLIGEEHITGKNYGVHTAFRADGTEILFQKRDRKLEFFDEATSEWIEIGTDIFPLAAINDDAAFGNYNSNAGAQLFISSPNSAFLLKIMTANPEDYTNLYDAAKNFYGRLKIQQNRMEVWYRGKDKTGLYQSYIDALKYTTVASETIGTGDGSTKAYSNTLAFKAAGAKRTCFGISVTDGVEIFSDDFNGGLVGDQGGTGTINYTTGEITVNFNSNVANLQAISAAYQWEDSTDTGIADFTYDAPDRKAGQGNIIRQDDGGSDLQNIGTYDSTDFCFHTKKTWQLSLGADDTTGTNTIYREKVGISNWRAMAETGDGIYYMDDIDTADPSFRLMTLSTTTAKVIPVRISKNIKLTDYRFDKGAVFEYGDLILFVCRHYRETENDTVFIYNKLWKCFDKRNFRISSTTVYKGKLIAGDSVTGSTYELFSGFTDNDSNIAAYWEGNYSRLDYMGLKKVKRKVYEGFIAPSQGFDIYANFDFSGFVKIGSVSGQGPYIDRLDSRFVLGIMKIGTAKIGSDSDGISVYHYQCQIKLKLDKFQYIKIKIVPNGIGYLSLENIIFEDIRLKGMKQPKKYRAINN